MTGRYIAFDVETPNSANDRISAIGVTVVERGAVVEQHDYLVNPETRFASFNVALTGITPEMVADKPAFPQLWQELEPIFDSGLLIAHNAPFDMSVLAKCLRDYGIRWRPNVPYACTCQMSRRLLPQLPNPCVIFWVWNWTTTGRAATVWPLGRSSCTICIPGQT